MNYEYLNLARASQWMTLASVISWASTAASFVLGIWQWGRLGAALGEEDASMSDLLLLGPSAIATSWLPLACILLIASCALTASACKSVAARRKAWEESQTDDD